ncbi:hypothetical protein PMW03_13750 [Clostridium paraputrificum]|uniref:hypothetical protein n=1 Tax=Clostridium paraputrificum TaxID=29363 RepID=UPI00232C6785|nr:hypothetical protein [Clostridium paraputrificum]MDB2111211.1 hypothetical protein [Clostridium paraputrificum]
MSDNFRIVTQNDIENYMTLIEDDARYIHDFIFKLKNTKEGKISELEESLKRLDRIIDISKGIKEKDDVLLCCSSINW